MDFGGWPNTVGECEMSRNGFPNCEREYNARQEAVEMAREERSRSMSELNSEFLARMNALVASAASPLAGPSRDNMWTLWLELPRLIALAEASALANEKDADRYRWLRDMNNDDAAMRCVQLCGAAMDEAIDEAIKGSAT